jgi:hypothetical protein
MLVEMSINPLFSSREGRYVNTTEVVQFRKSGKNEVLAGCKPDFHLIQKNKTTSVAVQKKNNIKPHYLITFNDYPQSYPYRFGAIE